MSVHSSWSLVMCKFQDKQKERKTTFVYDLFVDATNFIFAIL